MWYMGEGNYRDMVEGKTTQVYIPLPKENTDTDYHVPVFGIAYYIGGGGCYFRRDAPDGDTMVTKREDILADSSVHILRYDIQGIPSNSGAYVFNCATVDNITRQRILDLVMIQGL